MIGSVGSIDHACCHMMSPSRMQRGSRDCVGAGAHRGSVHNSRAEERGVVASTPGQVQRDSGEVLVGADGEQWPVWAGAMPRAQRRGNGQDGIVKQHGKTIRKNPTDMLDTSRSDQSSLWFSDL